MANSQKLIYLLIYGVSFDGNKKTRPIIFLSRCNEFQSCLNPVESMQNSKPNSDLSQGQRFITDSVTICAHMTEFMPL